MRETRRQFIRDIGYAAIGATLAANLPARAGAGQESDFDINQAFAKFMGDLGGTASDGGGKVTFTGSDPILRSHFRIGASMALPAMAAGVGAAAIWKDRTGQSQDLKVDLRESVYNVNPLLTLIMQHRQKAGHIPADDPIPSSFTFVPGINGGWYQAPWGLGNPFSFQAFETKDGRWVTLTGAYPHLNDRLLKMLRVPPVSETIVSAIKQQWTAADLDEAMEKTRAIGAIHRTSQEWAQHPEGQYLAKTPLIDIHKVGDSDPIPFPQNPTQPLSGVRTLALTHVIAGSCAARTLAEYGAEVLHVARDQSYEHPVLWTDVNVGMRSTFMDLRKPEMKQALAALIPKADVFMESFSGRVIEGLGFGVEDIVKKRPGIVYLTVRCYGWDGPWRERGGFDMEALTTTGFTLAEGAGGKPHFPDSFPEPEDSEQTLSPTGRGGVPAFPPTLVLNDYIAGYLGAAGVIAALRRRAKDGGSYHVRVSLSRAGMWYQTLGNFAETNFDATQPDHRMIAPEVVRGKTCYGEVLRLGPQVKLSKTPGKWREPLLIVRGSDKPVWEG